MTTETEIDGYLWDLVGAGKPEVVRYWYNRLMRMKENKDVAYSVRKPIKSIQIHGIARWANLGFKKEEIPAAISARR